MSCIASICVPGLAAAQRSQDPGPTIDTIIIVTAEVFGDDYSGGFYRFLNKIHITTRPRVIERDLLLGVGDPFDPRLAEDSERYLRGLGLFSLVEIDTVTVDGKLALRVATQDGWSTTPRIGFQVTGGVFTGRIGLSETNLLGTGNMVSAVYRKETDRHGLELTTNFERLLDSQVDIFGAYFGYSDGKWGFWEIGDPFRSGVDSRAIIDSGGVTDRRELQFRTVTTLDTAVYRHNQFFNRIHASFATTATSDRYIRVGGMAQFQAVKYVQAADSLLSVPDTLSGAFGVSAAYQASRHTVISPQANGFGQAEDLDLSFTLNLQLWAAPSAFGYARSGLGPQLYVAKGIGNPRGFAKAVLDANGLFTEAGLDSGRVNLELTAGFRSADKHWDLLYVKAGMQENPPPGQEFDLGVGSPDTLVASRRPMKFVGPRMFPPHSFTGTRTLWGTYEHRWFTETVLFNLLAVGYAAFFDFGGAWYPGQESRWGGNVGGGLRLGSNLTGGVGMLRLDLGYLFGDGVDETGENDRGLVFGIGSAFVY
jgi:hypothetical protein